MKWYKPEKARTIFSETQLGLCVLENVFFGKNWRLVSTQHGSHLDKSLKEKFLHLGCINKQVQTWITVDDYITILKKVVQNKLIHQHNRNSLGEKEKKCIFIIYFVTVDYWLGCVCRVESKPHLWWAERSELVHREYSAESTIK